MRLEDRLKDRLDGLLEIQIETALNMFNIKTLQRRKFNENLRFRIFRALADCKIAIKSYGD